MNKAKLSLAGLILILIAAMLAIGCSDSDDDPSDIVQQNESEARKIAREFIENSPTFSFDGMPDTLALTRTTSLSRCQFCWAFEFKFDSAHAGYGDRADQMLAQVITPHTATIIVEQGTITHADLDDKWNMYTQEPLGKNPPSRISVDDSYSGKTIQAPVEAIITVSLESNPSTGFGWSLISISDENVLGEDGHLFEAPQATEPPVVGAGGSEIWTFKTIQNGSSTIEMAYSRPWESVPPAGTFTLTIQVEDKNISDSSIKIPGR